MSEEDKAMKEVLEAELEHVQMLRRKAKDAPVMAIAAAKRELAIKKEMENLTEGIAA